MDWFSEPMLTLYGTIFGGVGLKIVEKILGRAGRKEDLGSSLRTELRSELTTMRSEMEKLKKEADLADKSADGWRNKYYSLLAAVARNDIDEARRHLN